MKSLLVGACALLFAGCTLLGRTTDTLEPDICPEESVYCSDHHDAQGEWSFPDVYGWNVKVLPSVPDAELIAIADRLMATKEERRRFVIFYEGLPTSETVSEFNVAPNSVDDPLPLAAHDGWIVTIDNREGNLCAQWSTQPSAPVGPPAC